jgi:ATP-dependent DNA helicase RecG
MLLGRRDSARLRALATHSDGFALAEIDLRLRGEGELGGSRQHGAAQHKFATLPDDAELLERARLQAERIAACDPKLEQPEHTLIAQALRLRLGPDASAPLDA